MATRAPSITRSIVNRAVHIDIHPRPRNIDESREALHLLSRFGEVEYFRNLRYDREPNPNTALAIFKDEAAAQYAIQKHQIRFRIDRVASKTPRQEDYTSFTDSQAPAVPTEAATVPEQNASLKSATPVPPRSLTGSAAPVAQPNLTGAFGLTQTRSLSTNSLPKPPRAPPSNPFGFASSSIPPLKSLPDDQEHRDDESSEDQTQKPRVFKMYINAASYDFAKHAEMGHYHGGFINDWRSAVNDDLRKRTPLKGIANLDWRLKTKSATTIKQGRAAIKDKLGGLGEMYRQAQENAALTSGDGWKTFTA